MKVFCYRNLRRTRWSIKALEGPDKGHVIGHEQTVILSDVQARVQQSGRQRVLRERRKNVHAGLAGQLETDASVGNLPLLALSKISYNPYKAPTFLDHLGQPVLAMDRAYLGADGKVTALNAR